MGSDKYDKYDKYSPLYHDAPEVVSEQDAPEVVKNTDPPIYRPRQTSVDQPEAIQTGVGHEKADGHYPDSAAPTYQSKDARYDEKGNAIGSTEAQQGKAGRRYCGMRRGVFIAVIVLLILVVLGVVLGAALGTTLSNNGNSSKKPLQATSMTGLATTVQGGTVYQYFQSPDHAILENTYSNGKWSLQAGSNMKDATVTSGAGAGSPIAAISYPYNGEKVRQLFYITSEGQVTTVNRTESRSWGIATRIAATTAQPGAIGLTACWGGPPMNGIQVFYGSSYNNHLQYVTGAFDGRNWTEGVYLRSSDGSSGAACSVHTNTAHQYLNVYFRNITSSGIDQTYFDFRHPEAEWSWGPSNAPVSWSNHSAPVGTDIAVCDDPASTEYVYYQLSNGAITRATTDPTTSYFESFDTFGSATVGTKLAASWVQQGAMVAFQNGSSASTMWAQDISRDGATIFDVAIS